jgi:hypothetical protein
MVAPKGRITLARRGVIFFDNVIVRQFTTPRTPDPTTPQPHHLTTPVTKKTCVMYLHNVHLCKLLT